MKDKDWFGAQLTLDKAVKYTGEFDSPEAKEDFDLWCECCEHVAKMYVDIEKTEKSSK